MVWNLKNPKPWTLELGAVNPKLYNPGPRTPRTLNPYSQSGKVGRWFTEICAWRTASSNFKFGRLCFISSKFHIFQLWCTKCLPAGTAAFRNTPNILRGHRGIAFTQVLAVPRLTGLHSEPRPNCLAPSTGGRDSKHGGIASSKYWQFLNAVITCPQCVSPSTGGSQNSSGHGGIAFTQVRAFPEPTVLHPEPRRKCFAPSSDGIQNQSTARGSRFPPNPHPQCFAPSTGGIQNQSTAWGHPFPPCTWTHRQSVFLKYWQNYERSRRTTDPGMRGAGRPFPGCGAAGRFEERNTVFFKGSSLEDRTKRLAPFGDHAGCRTAQNGKLED